MIIKVEMLLDVDESKFNYNNFIKSREAKVRFVCQTVLDEIKSNFEYNDRPINVIVAESYEGGKSHG
jgi:hypothetical protein